MQPSRSAGVVVRIAILLLSLGSWCAGQAHGQCILANPSFELDGSGGAAFGGWSQFGAVGETAVAVHGAQAARVRGPNSGDWDVSGVWQRLDSSAHSEHNNGAEQDR